MYIRRMESPIERRIREQQEEGLIRADRIKEIEKDPVYTLMKKAAHLRYDKLNGKYAEKHFRLFTIFAPEKVLRHIDKLFGAEKPLDNFLGLPTFAGLDDQMTLYYNDEFIGTIMLCEELPLFLKE